MHAQKVLRGGALAQYWAGTPEFKLHRGDATARSSLAYTALPSIWMPLVPQNTCRHPDPYHAQRWTPPCPAALARRPAHRPWPGLLKPPCFPALPLQLQKSLPGQCQALPTPCTSSDPRKVQRSVKLPTTAHRHAGQQYSSALRALCLTAPTPAAPSPDPSPHTQEYRSSSSSPPFAPAKPGAVAAAAAASPAGVVAGAGRSGKRNSDPNPRDCCSVCANACAHASHPCSYIY